MEEPKESYGAVEKAAEAEASRKEAELDDVGFVNSSSEDGDSTAPEEQKESSWWTLLGSLRMEPGFLLYMIASVMGNIMASDLQIDRACRVNLGYNDTVCDGVMST